MIKLDDHARRSLQASREDLTRTALERKQLALPELEGLDQQIAGLELEQEKLTNAEQRLQAKVSAFRTKKEIIKAQYSAAQAQVRIGSALSGLSEEMGDISLAVERAETKTENLRAKAGAIDELASTGGAGRCSHARRRRRHRAAVTGGHRHGRRRRRTRCPQGGTRPAGKGASGGAVMIVRILTEGQYNLPGAHVDRLDELDNRLVEVVEAEDEEASDGLLKELLDVVRENGSPEPLDEIVESDIVLPEPDITLVEAERLLTGEGIIPD